MDEKEIDVLAKFHSPDRVAYHRKRATRHAWLAKCPLKIFMEENLLRTSHVAHYLGVHSSTVSHWLLGAEPRDEQFGKIADMMDMTAGALGAAWGGWRRDKPE